MILLSHIPLIVQFLYDLDQLKSVPSTSGLLLSSQSSHFVLPKKNWEDKVGGLGGQNGRIGRTKMEDFRRTFKTYFRLIWLPIHFICIDLKHSSCILWFILRFFSYLTQFHWCLKYGLIKFQLFFQLLNIFQLWTLFNFEHFLTLNIF